ncbi:hypothetical protein A2U01_0114103, partial [Trifolium medium]|nr:hypothetical protein [Trifolium medium]
MVLLNVACTNCNLTIRDKIDMFLLEKEIAFLEGYASGMIGDNFWDKFLDAENEIIDPI